MEEAWPSDVERADDKFIENGFDVVTQQSDMVRQTVDEMSTLGDNLAKKVEYKHTNAGWLTDFLQLSVTEHKELQGTHYTSFSDELKQRFGIRYDGESMRPWDLLCIVWTAFRKGKSETDHSNLLRLKTIADLAYQELNTRGLWNDFSTLVRMTADILLEKDPATRSHHMMVQEELYLEGCVLLDSIRSTVQQQPHSEL